MNKYKRYFLVKIFTHLDILNNYLILYINEKSYDLW